MLCKGIVDKVIDAYSARVRIPIYHQIESSPFATPEKDLPIAAICVMPGVEMALKRGDIVFVDFEMDLLEHPIIIGCLSRQDSKSSSNIKAQSLSVEVNCELPDDTRLSKEEQQRQTNFYNVVNEVTIPSLDVEFLTD